MRTRPFVLSVLALAAAAWPAAARAGAQTRFGEEDGVRAVAVAGEKVVIRFTGRSAAALKRVRGRFVEVSCVDLPPRDGLIHGDVIDGGQLSTSQRVPRRGTRMVLRDMRRPDVCFVTSTAKGRRVRVTAVVSDDGRGYWTDGARHVVGPVTTREGRRLFYEDEGAETVRTNIFGAASWLIDAG